MRQSSHIKSHSVTILAREGTVNQPKLRPIEVVAGLSKPQALTTMREHQAEHSAFGKPVYAYVVR